MECRDQCLLFGESRARGFLLREEMLLHRRHSNLDIRCCSLCLFMDACAKFDVIRGFW